MKSKVLKIRNLPSDMQILNEIRVKPVGSLVALEVISIVILVSGSSVAIVGVVLLSLSTYALLIMPDRILMQFTEEYLVVYNRKNREECMLIYWDEVMTWQYQKRNNEDLLWLQLVDGQSETIECYNRNRVVPYLKIYAKGKERIPRTVKRRRTESGSRVSR